MRNAFVLVATVATLAACAESPTQMTDLDASFARSENAQGRVVGSASGSGHALCTPDGADCRSEAGGESLTERYDLDERDLALRSFSFNARLYEDGTARGKAQFNNRGREQAWDVDVGCVLFRPSAPNQVWMMGTLTRGYGQAPAPGGLPYEVGARVLFAVEDNGEGSAAAPDRLVGFAPLPEANYLGLCPVFNAQVELPPQVLPFDFIMAAFAFDPIRGNVQVRAPSD